MVKPGRRQNLWANITGDARGKRSFSNIKVTFTRSNHVMLVWFVMGAKDIPPSWSCSTQKRVRQGELCAWKMPIGSLDCPILQKLKLTKRRQEIILITLCRHLLPVSTQLDLYVKKDTDPTVPYAGKKLIAFPSGLFWTSWTLISSWGIPTKSQLSRFPR